MTTQLNPQQQAAIDADAPAIVLSAGAGCGKTTVLVQRYLRLLRSQAATVREIVAITFTERAARQMRRRVRVAIDAELGSSPNSPWEQFRDDLERAAIDTIHGFCGSVLREFFAEAGVDPNFAVLDEPLASSLREEAVRRELHRLLLVESEAGTDLQELVVLYGWPAVLSTVERFVVDAEPSAWQAWLAREPEAIVAEWLAFRGPLWPRMVAYLEAAEPWVVRAVEVMDSVRPTVPKARDRMATVRGHWADLRTATDCDRLSALADLLKDAAKVQGTKATDWPDPASYEAVKEAFESLRKKIEKCIAPFTGEPADVAKTVVVARRFLTVAIHAEAAYREAKRFRNAYDFQDLLVRTRDLLAQHDVCDALRGRFKVLLLDELQDTDPVQMAIVERLCGRAPQHVQLFAVGDEKQSIYRFRGADVGLFRELRDRVPAAARLSLTVNYRSRPGIIRFVNALFAKRLSNYEPLTANRAEAAGPTVEFLWSLPAEDVKDESAEEVRTREADAIATHLVELFRQNVQPKDVTILFRSMTNVALYEAALRQKKIDYYLVGGRAFFAQQEIYDLHNLLQAIENPFNGPALAGALRSPFFNLTDDGLVILGLHDDGLWAGLFDASRFAKLPVVDQPVVQRARKSLAEWRYQKDRLPIARLLGQIFAESGFDATTQFEPLAERKLANLWKLVDLARQFDAGGFGLAPFAERLGNQVADQPREEQAATTPAEANVVRLMTIHQAKGLEFPVVVIADIAARQRMPMHAVARWDRRLGCLPKLPTDLTDGEEAPFSEFPHDLGKTADEIDDWQEDLRTFYVACTRAEERLILSAGFGKELPESGPPTDANHVVMLLAERFNLATGECLANDGTEAVRVVTR